MIDKKIRSQRTKDEERILRKAYEAGLNVPKVIGVDEFTITMGIIVGQQLTEFIK